MDYARHCTENSIVEIYGGLHRTTTLHFEKD